MARSTIVLGKGMLAIRVARWLLENDEYELAAIVPVVPEPEWTDSLVDWAAAEGIECVESGDWRDLPGSGRCGDLGVSVFYDRIIRPEGIARFGRLLNIHNSPLPRYRGVAPINWALKNGERSHGVTIHEVSPGVDDGPIVAQLRYSIYPEFDEVVDVYRRALEYGWVLFAQTMPILDRIAARPQREEEATMFTSRDVDRLEERRSFTRELSRR
jgi:methionyl-tRNA formyltransferase